MSELLTCFSAWLFLKLHQDNNFPLSSPLTFISILSTLLIVTRHWFWCRLGHSLWRRWWLCSLVASTCGTLFLTHSGVWSEFCNLELLPFVIFAFWYCTIPGVFENYCFFVLLAPLSCCVLLAQFFSFDGCFVFCSLSPQTSWSIRWDISLHCTVSRTKSYITSSSRISTLLVTAYYLGLSFCVKIADRLPHLSELNKI